MFVCQYIPNLVEGDDEKGRSPRHIMQPKEGRLTTMAHSAYDYFI